MANITRNGSIGNTVTYRIKSHVTLPFELEKRIGIDLLQVSRLLQIGGIKQLTIVNDPAGKSERAVPLILGFDKNGTAFAGATKTNTIPPANSESDHKGNRNQYSAQRWINITVKINTEQIKSDILQSGKKVNDPNIWAETLNSVIKKEILISGVKNLWKRTLPDKIYMLVVLSMLIQDISRWHDDLSTLALGVLITLGISITMWNIMISLMFGGEQSGEGSRFSVFTSYPEIDRMIFLYAVNHNATLIKSFDT